MASFERIEAFAWELEQAEVQYYQQRGWAADKFYASSYIDCGRQQIFKINHPEEHARQEASTMVLQYKREAALGDFVHETLQKWAVATGKIITLPDFQRDPVARNVSRKNGGTMPAIEVPIANYTIDPEKHKTWKRLRLGGKCDGILKSSTGEHFIWEIKTVADRNMNGSGEKYLADKLAHYESQVQLYLWAFGIRRGLIMVVNRERFLDRYMGRIDWAWGDIYQEYMVDYNEDFVLREFVRLEELGEHLVGKTLPVGEKGRGPCIN